MAGFTTRDKTKIADKPGNYVINGYPMPDDTICTIDGEKVIAENKIADGGYIFERVSLKPYELNFEFTIRDNNPTFIDKTKLIDGGTLTLGWIFPQEKIEKTLRETFKVDVPVKVENSYLNGIGVTSIIIKTISLRPARGTTDVVGNIKAWEDTGEDSSTLIIPEEPLYDSIAPDTLTTTQGENIA